MNTKESITFSLDGSDTGLLPYFPYLLQDIWELGSSPKILLNMLVRSKVNESIKEFNILDLGCGKGAVSIPVIREYGGKLLGIDAVPEFIETATHLSDQFGISDSCSFKAADIRKELESLTGYNLILISSIGPVLGNVQETLVKAGQCLSAGGYIFLDDGYIPDESGITLDKVLTENEFISQIEESSFEIIDKYIYNGPEMSDSNEKIYRAIKQRADELSVKYPDKKNIFEKYLEDQRVENEVLENKITCAAFLLKKIQ